MKLIRLILIFSVIFSFKVSATDIKLTETENNLTIVKNNLTEFTFINHLSKLQTAIVKTEEGEFIKLIVPGYGENAKQGNAELPVLKELINVPLGSSIDIQVLNIEEEIVELSNYGINKYIIPSQPSISKATNVEDIPFYFNKDYYNKNIFFDKKLVDTQFLGLMRGQQLARITISPFKYNPVKNQIRVVTKMEIRIIFKNIDITSHISNRKKYYSPQFEHLYKSCLNYLPIQSKDLITTYPVKYVIISDPAFETALQPLVEWKTKKGFIVVEGYTSDPLVGSTTTSIHAYLKDMYDNASLLEPAPTYLLIVGDIAEVPSFNGLTDTHVSDMYFCEFDGGGDFYPEMYYGRFSANSVSEVEVQVNKTLTHEQYTFGDPSFLDNLVLVAGVDQTWAPVHGNGQINYGTDNYFNIAHGLTVHNYLYGSGTPITSDMSTASSAIIANVGQGVSFANYTAHCGTSGWADPSFSTSDIPNLDNDDKYGFMIGNCCQSNMFDVPLCFGEALLRENNKGAVGYVGGSNNTYWDEDYWWSVGNGSVSINPTYAGTGLALYDCIMHENGEQEADWFITAGQTIHAGNLAVTQAGGMEQYYWEIYHLMGDPSLMPYIGVPTTLTVSHALASPVGINTFTVNTEENAYVAISMNGVLLDAQLADVTGVVNLNFSSISNVGNVDIVVTKQFKKPYQAVVQIISPNGPYVVYATNTIDDSAGNNNFLVDYNELINMNVDVQNIGSTAANSITLTLSTADTFVNIINNSSVINTINSMQVLNIPNTFTFKVADVIPDQHITMFNLEMTDNLNNSWNSTIHILLNSPELSHTGFNVQDLSLGNGNSLLDPGETVDLIIEVINMGHANINNLTATIDCSSPYITVNTSSLNIPNLSVNGQYSTVFNISIDPNTPVGTLAQFSFEVTDSIYFYNNTFTQNIGIIDEDYETGDFTKYNWIIDPDFPWVIDSLNVFEGNNSTKSINPLPDGEVSHLKMTINVVADGEISFYKFVSSEQDYDFLQFYIDGNKQGEWSGQDTSWSFVSYPINIGTHDLNWEYDKDGSTSEGDDCAWLDYIVFPAMDFGQTTLVNDIDLDFKIFPNPNIGSFNIIFNDKKFHIVELFDPNGKMIIRMNDQFNSSSFNIKDLATGIYILRVMPEGITYQIIKN